MIEDISNKKWIIKQLYDSDKKGLLINGEKIDSELKNKSVERIKNAIEQNKNLNLTRVSKEDFVNGFPESLHLFSAYFSSLYTCGKYSGLKYKDFLQEENEYGLLFAKYFADMNDRERNFSYDNDNFARRYSEITGLSYTDCKRIIYAYDELDDYKSKIIPKEQAENKLKELVDLLVVELLENNLSKNAILKKYSITSTEFDNAILIACEKDSSLASKIKDKLQSNAKKSYALLVSVIDEITNYVNNGIEIDGKNFNFGMLDYYSLTSVNIDDLDKLRRKISSNNASENRNRAIAFAKLKKMKNVGPFVSKNKILESNIKYTINGVDYLLDEEELDKLISILKENNIPTNREIIYSAFIRDSKNLPILPLSKSEKSNNDELNEMLSVDNSSIKEQEEMYKK